MIYLYAVVVMMLLVYFGRRHVDVFTAAFVSSAIYFMPALFPVYQMPADAYIVYVTVMLLTFVFSLLFDHSGYAPAVPRALDVPATRRYGRGALLVMIPLLLWSIWSVQLTDVTSKAESGGGLLHYALAVMLGYVFACSVVLSRRFWIVVCLAIYGWMILRGDRTQFVLAVIATLLLICSTRRYTVYRLLLTTAWHRIALVLLAVTVGLFGKDIYGAYFETGTDVSYADALVRRLDATVHAPAASFEPYHVQSILSMAIQDNERISPEYLYGLPLQTLPFSGGLGGSVHYQSEVVKGLYFGEWSEAAGVSSNFFAEGFLLWGMSGAIAFSVIYVGMLFPLAAALARGRVIVRLWACFASAFWAFYIHRSSLFQMIAHEKRIIYAALFLVAMSGLVRILVKVGQRNAPVPRIDGPHGWDH